MGDKVRGALTGIDWSKSNEVSINTNNNHASKRPAQKSKQQAPVAPVSRQAPASSGRMADDGDIPVNPYRSIVAPVKSGKDEDRPPPNRTSVPRSSRQTSREETPEEDLQVYLGYLGSIRMSTESVSTGILAIQGPMKQLYFPYREKKTFAQERVLGLNQNGVEVYYLPDEEADDPVSFTIPWNDVLYVEPLRFSTKKPSKDKKMVRSAFEPSEAQRLAMLGNRDSLFTPLSKQHKHISLLKHPALLCMVVRNPHGINEVFTHGYVCSTVEESVFLARKIRDELEVIYRESLRFGQKPTPELKLSASMSSISSAGYRIDKQKNNEAKLKSKKKFKKEKGVYTTHTGGDDEDFGSFHFGMSLTSSAPGHMTSSYDHNYASEDEEITNSLNENFVIGRPGPRLSENRPRSQHSHFSEMDIQGSHRGNDGRPVGVVQPQQMAGFKVLPTDGLGADKSKLKPTAINVKTNKFNEVTPELDLKLRMRQEGSEPVFSSLAPRTVLNPLADSEPEPRRTFLSPAPGPISKRNTPMMGFNPSAALPDTGWHDSVLSNFKSKEKIENRLSSQTVDIKELPKMGSDKKEMEMASLFSDMDMGTLQRSSQPPTQENKPINSLHDALGFMP